MRGSIYCLILNRMKGCVLFWVHGCPSDDYSVETHGFTALNKKLFVGLLGVVRDFYRLTSHS
jgi:hypothetical protein